MVTPSGIGIQSSPLTGTNSLVNNPEVNINTKIKSVHPRLKINVLSVSFTLACVFNGDVSLFISFIDDPSRAEIE